MKFTPANVKALTNDTGKAQRTISDDALPGLKIVIGATGKAWMIQTETRRKGIRRTYKRTIGRFPNMSVAEARKEARRVIQELVGGPVQPRGNGVTLAEAWERYRGVLEAKVAVGKRSARTVESYNDCITRVLKKWLDTPLRHLAEEAEMVAQEFDTITRSHGPVMANRALKSLRMIYRYAKTRMDRTLPSGLPTDSIDWHEEVRRDTALSYAELAPWAAQLEKLPAVRRAFHEFSLLSGARPDALRQARWEHLDVKARTLFFPASVMKGNKDFTLPLSREMLACLCRAKRAGQHDHRVNARQWVFPAGHSAQGCLSYTREDRGTLSKWGSDLRQSWATAARAVGIGELFSHVLLNHTLGSVSSGYVTPAALGAPLWTAQEAVSVYLVAGMKGKELS